MKLYKLCKNMIPFKLFKYIFFRDFLYSIVYGILPCIVIYGLITFNCIVSRNSLNILLLIFSVLISILAICYYSKLVLEKVILKTYDRIQIITNIKEISWNLFFTIFGMKFLMMLGINLIIYFVYGGITYICYGVFCELNDFFNVILSLGVDYIVLNAILEKYINVIPKNKEEDNNNSNVL